MKTTLIITLITATLAPLTTLAEDHHTSVRTNPSSEQEAGVKPYPLETCIVSDEDLDSMGEPISFIYKNQELKVCCKPCIKKFNQDPEKYLKKIKDLPSEE